jgi:hypothetical protein
MKAFLVAFLLLLTGPLQGQILSTNSVTEEKIIDVENQNVQLYKLVNKQEIYTVDMYVIAAKNMRYPSGNSWILISVLDIYDFDEIFKLIELSQYYTGINSLWVDGQILQYEWLLTEKRYKIYYENKYFYLSYQSIGEIQKAFHKLIE